MSSSKGPRPPSNDAEDPGRRLQNFKSHLYVLTFKEKKKKKKPKKKLSTSVTSLEKRSRHD